MEVKVDVDGTQQLVIHLEVDGKLACAPDAGPLHASGRPYPLLRTGEWKNVTCAFCQSPAFFKEKSAVPTRKVV